MAGTNSPANAFQARRFASQGASSGLAAGHGGRGGGVGGGFHGGGGNPIAGAIQEGDAGPLIQTQDVPIHGLGTAFLNLALHPVMEARREEEQARSDARIQEAAEKKQAPAQAALDSYQKAMDANPGNPHQALMDWSKSPDGIAASLDQNAWAAVTRVHGLQNAADPNAPPQVIKDQSGLSFVNMDGKWHAFTPKQMEASATAQKAAQGPVYDKKPPANFDQKLQSVDTILRNIDTLTASSGATGSLGWGKFERVAARNTPLTAQQNAAYNAAYDQLVPAVLQLNRVAGFNDKDSKEMIKNMLPDPKLATNYLLAQSIPMIKDQARHVAGQLYDEARAGKYADFASVEHTAKTYDATPELMREKDEAIKTLMGPNPGALRPDHTALLQNEFKAGNLTGIQQENIAVQLGLRGVLTPSQMAKLSEAYPGIAQKFQDPAHQPVDPTWRRPLAPEPAAVGQPIQAPETVAPPPAPVQTPNAAPAQGPGAQAAPVAQNTAETVNPSLSQTPIGQAAAGAAAAMGAKPANATPRTPEEMYGGVPAPAVQPAPPTPAGPVPAGMPSGPVPPQELPGPGLGDKPQQRGDVGPGNVLAALNPISSAMAAEAPPGQQADATPAEGARAALPPPQPMAEDRGAAAGATPLPEDVRQLLFQINQTTAAHLAGSAPPPPADTGNQEGKTIPLPKKQSDESE